MADLTSDDTYWSHFRRYVLIPPDDLISLQTIRTDPTSDDTFWSPFRRYVLVSSDLTSEDTYWSHFGRYLLISLQTTRTDLTSDNTHWSHFRPAVRKHLTFKIKCFDLILDNTGNDSIISLTTDWSKFTHHTHWSTLISHKQAKSWHLTLSRAEAHAILPNGCKTSPSKTPVCTCVCVFSFHLPFFLSPN